MHCSGAAFHIYPTIFCPLHTVSERCVARNCTADTPDLPCGFGPFCVFSPRKRIPKLPLLHSKTATFALQNCHFCVAKRTVLECKTHHFGMQNAPFWNADNANWPENAPFLSPYGAVYFDEMGDFERFFIFVHVLCPCFQQHTHARIKLPFPLFLCMESLLFPLFLCISAPIFPLDL